jgi:hypothetical protein
LRASIRVSGPGRAAQRVFQRGIGALHARGGVDQGEARIQRGDLRRSASSRPVSPRASRCPARAAPASAAGTLAAALGERCASGVAFLRRRFDRRPAHWQWRW